MLSEESSARLALPLLQPGQAQKEVYHNESVARLDLPVQASVVPVGTNTPPVSPAIGACWVVGAAPIGAWAAAADQLAGWTSGGWRFVRPVEGMAVWSIGDAVEARFSGSGWALGEVRGGRVLIGGTPVVGPRQSAIAGASGGTIADAEARAAIDAILAALRAHGLIAP